MATAPKTEKASGLAELLRSPSLSVLLAASAMAIGLAALLPLVQSSDATSTNGNIQRLEQQKADWQARLHELELGVASLGSLDRIEREARERLKMTEPGETRYLTMDVPAPGERRLPSRFLPPQSAEQKRSASSIWEKLFGWLPLP